MCEYPILCAQYDAKHPSDVAICENCEHEERWDVASGDPEGMCISCRCGGAIVMKYVEADACLNCGKLGFFHHALKRCCSRPCMLQKEWADELAARRVLDG